MQSEVVALLEPAPQGIYCDGTLGGGGHAEAILESSPPTSRLIGIDRDEAALDAARKRLDRFGDRVTLVHGTFSQAPKILGDLGAIPLDGMVLDLGVSSPQFDQKERGFSFRQEGPLDMRMDQSCGESAAELIERISVYDLAVVLKRYGEERYARRIARAIKEAVATEALSTTTELAALIAAAVPTQERHKDPATRTFQALRIVVNNELGELEQFLQDFLPLFKPGGRLVVIAFHSLEDVLIKNRFRDLARDPGLPADIAASLGVRDRAEVRLLTRKPERPSEEEVAGNPRARSARLRAVERM